MDRGRAWRSLWNSYPMSPIVKKFGLCMCAVETVSSPLLRGGRSGFFCFDFVLPVEMYSAKRGVDGVVCVWDHAKACSLQ